MTKKRKAEATGQPKDLHEKKKRATEEKVSKDSAKHTEKLGSLLDSLINASNGAERRRIGAEVHEALATLVKPNPLASKSSSNGGPIHDASVQTPESLFPALPILKDPKLEKAVFTHQGSLHADDNTSDLLSYERLEFLGDAYIEVMATRLIWSRYAALSTGRLSHLRENLVKNETLGEFSVNYGFHQRVHVPKQVESSTKAFAKIKGDLFEAYVAAIILDDPVFGFERAEAWLHQLWEPKLKEVEPSSGPNMKAKEELARRIGGKLIKINYVDEKPPVQMKGGISNYFVGVYLTGWGYENQHLGSGVGLNKKSAGNEAATEAMDNHPLIDDIIMKKREFDATVKKERESEKDSNTTKERIGRKDANGNTPSS